MSEARSLRTALASAERLLASAGVPCPRADAHALAAHLLQVSPGELARLLLLGAPAPAGLDELVTRRADRVPLQHLVGGVTFRHSAVRVGPGVFVPRPETETVAGHAVDEAARVSADQGTVLVADLCTGSAAIAIAVAQEVPASRLVAVELDPAAFAWAEQNVAASGAGDRIILRRGDVTRCDRTLLAEFAGEVDVVVANPPYIPPDGVPHEPEVRDHDPALALYGGGDDGLEVPRAVVAASAVLLRPGGLLVMEHGDAQGAPTRALAGAGWDGVRTARDLTGRDRMLLARRAR